MNRLYKWKLPVPQTLGGLDWVMLCGAAVSVAGSWGGGAASHSAKVTAPAALPRRILATAS